MPGDRLLTSDTPRSDGERGSLSVFTAFFAFAVLLLLAVLVDGGNALSARERAADVAEQGARAAVTDLSIPDLRSATDSTVAVDWGTACGYARQAIQDYAATFGSSAIVNHVSCSPGANPQTAVVTVTVTSSPVIPGFPSLTMTATQSATALCGNADQEEEC